MTKPDINPIDALAVSVHEIRPKWPWLLILKNLQAAALTRPHSDLSIDALDAARNPNIKSPGALLTHRAGALDCTTCTNRNTPEPRRPRCTQCRELTDPTYPHICPPAKPSRLGPLIAELTREYQPLISQAPDTPEGRAEVARLQAEWDRRVADATARRDHTQNRAAG